MAIDHVHARQAANRLHVDDVAIHHQIAPFHQLHPHLLRQEAVLEVGAVVDAGREQHDHRRAVAARGKRSQDLAELAGIVADRQHIVHVKDVGKRARHHGAILQHVGDAAGRAHVVFQHQVITGLGIADQIDTSDVRVNSRGRLQADHLAAEMLAGVHQRAGDAPVLENALRSVYILQKQV